MLLMRALVRLNTGLLWFLGVWIVLVGVRVRNFNGYRVNTVPNRVDRSNRYRDITIFRLSRERQSAILDFQKNVIFMADRVERAKMRHPAKLHDDWSIRC